MNKHYILRSLKCTHTHATLKMIEGVFCPSYWVFKVYPSSLEILLTWNLNIFDGNTFKRDYIPSVQYMKGYISSVQYMKNLYKIFSMFMKGKTNIMQKKWGFR